MKYPYGLVADCHAHLWSQFSKTELDGVNSRLRIILNELKRCAKEVKAAGGDLLIMAGDVFHTRGNIDPEVLNPLRECLAEIKASGVDIAIGPGNHDLKGKDTEALGSAVEALRHCALVAVEPSIVGCTIIFPWRISTEALLEDMRDQVKSYPSMCKKMDAIIHAPVNDVLPGLPNHGLDPKELAKLGFRRVLAGHHHNHKDFGNGVYSIGATTQQTWGDVGSKAGFLLVYEDKVVYRASHAPEFIVITDKTDPSEISMIVPGNYVKADIGVKTEKEINAYREMLIKEGAAGVIINATKTPVITRASATSASCASLETSIKAWIDDRKYSEEVWIDSVEILNEARSATE